MHSTNACQPTTAGLRWDKSWRRGGARRSRRFDKRRTISSQFEEFFTDHVEAG